LVVDNELHGVLGGVGLLAFVVALGFCTLRLCLPASLLFTLVLALTLFRRSLFLYASALRFAVIFIVVFIAIVVVTPLDHEEGGLAHATAFHALHVPLRTVQTAPP
jgi:MFS superfamily sulfate permease-like transporter